MFELFTDEEPVALVDGKYPNLVGGTWDHDTRSTFHKSTSALLSQRFPFDDRDGLYGATEELSDSLCRSACRMLATSASKDLRFVETLPGCWLYGAMMDEEHTRKHRPTVAWELIVISLPRRETLHHAYQAGHEIDRR